MSVQKIVKAAALTAVATSLLAAPAQADVAKEKCYGVSKAGKNDCASGKNSCAGSAKVDSQGDAFIVLPKGICERLAGSSLKAM
ncbi:MAG: DUF2282 domain-containing protein [Pseudomonadota bacterium]